MKKKLIFDNFDYSNINLSYKGNFKGNINYSKIFKDKFKVQGFTVTDKYYLISAYCILKNRSKSRIYFFDKDNSKYLGFIILDNSSHVGGISFDNFNKLLYVTGSKGKVNVYNYENIIELFIKNNYYLDLNSIDKSLYYIKSNINISNILDGNVSAATIYYYNNYLYVATCSNKGSLVKVKIEYLKNEKAINSYMTIISKELPACIQGLIIFDYNDKLFFVISQSYGMLSSTLKLFDLDNISFIGQKRFRTIGIEGIDMNSCGLIKVIFENGSKKSSLIDINKLVNKIDVKKENKYIRKGIIHQKKLDNRS